MLAELDADILASANHPHHLILTPNRRLQRTLHQAFAQHAAGSKTVWRTPNIVDIEDYLDQFWSAALARGEAACGARYLLSQAEELELWRQAALAATDNVLLAAGSTAAQLQKAWSTLWRWNIDPLGQELRQAARYQPDEEYFIRAAEVFSQACDRLGALSRAKCPAVCSVCLPPALERVILFEFDELTPAYQSMFEAWKLIPEMLSQEGDLSRNIEVAAAPNTREEIRQAAIWARAYTEQHTTARVAVVIPELKHQRRIVETEFIDVLSPDYFLPHTPSKMLDINISAGIPLLEMPMVAAAVQLWHLNTGTIEVQDMAKLLYSPYLCMSDSEGGNDGEALAELEALCRDFECKSLPLSTLQREAANTSPELADRIATILLAHQSTRVRSAAQWLQLFDQQLEAFGWPGKRPLDSQEYQLLQRFQQFREDLPRTLCLRFTDEETLPVHEVMSFLRDQLASESFQPESLPGQIDILGTLEATGQAYDAIWVSGLNDHSWPAPARPSPYIPIALQRQLNMPNSSAEREQKFAAQLLHRYATHCQHLVCSYPLTVNESECLPSPLLENLFPEAVQYMLAPTKAELPTEALALEYLTDDAGAPLADTEPVTGVVDLLRRQAQCPFQAFARYRLNSPAWSSPSLGWSPRIRGIVLHDCLQALWQQLLDSKGLAKQSAEDIQQLVAAVVPSVLEKHKAKLQLYASRLAELETQRLQNLLGEWLRHESERDSFSVLDCELKIELQIFERTMRLRIDRVDQLDDGSVLMIDYKSGAVEPSALTSETLLQPQLPLYALAWQQSGSPQALSGVALASVKRQDAEWRGLGSGASPGMKIAKQSRGKDQPDWAAVRTQWQASLQSLEAEYMSARATTTPVHKTSCTRCDYQTVCRFKFASTT